jgi:hypothetical protein
MGKTTDPFLVSDFFDVVENGPKAIPKVIANAVVPGAGCIFSKKVRETLGSCVKPKNWRSEKD